MIGMVGRLDVIKDQATLIRAAAKLRSRKELELWLVGAGPRNAELRALAATLGIADSVVFWGGRSDVAELLGGIDVYAFSTTRDEGFGIAVIEAMAAALPIVASDVPACREVLADGTAGILVPAGDAEAMAQVLERLIGLPEQQAYWGKLAYKRVKEQYDIELCANRWYSALLGGTREPHARFDLHGRR